MLPLTPAKIRAIAAQMKASGYRSFPNFAVAAKEAHLSSFLWSEELERCRRQCVASTQRGIGPPRQCMVIPIDRLAALQLGSDPVAAGGPISPGHWGTLCAFHLVRGAEAACALASSLTLDREAKTETWWLPASKTDPTAVGSRRTWGCVCGSVAAVGMYTGSPPCPFHAALALVHELHRRFGTGAGLPLHLPLFPDEAGQWCARAGFIDSITAFTVALELSPYDSMGRCQIGEHVWRVTGARMLAALDLPQPVIMLLARWGSEAILRYVADAPLSRLTEAYLERVQKASVSVLGTVPADCPASLAAFPAYTPAALALADASASALLTEPALVAAQPRFTTNDSTGSQFVHIIAARQAWERPKPGRTICGWDYLTQRAPVFFELPSGLKRCGTCATAIAWQRFIDVPSDSD